MVDLLKVVVYAVEWLITRIAGDVILIALTFGLILAVGWWIVRWAGRRGQRRRAAK